MKEKLEQIRAAAAEQLNAVGADLEAIRIRFLGKKGELTAVLRGMGQLSAEERPVIGQLANEVREYIERLIAEKTESQKRDALENKLKSERLDVTMPARRPSSAAVIRSSRCAASSRTCSSAWASASSTVPRSNTTTTTSKR